MQLENFPPFYTRQPNDETWSRQCDLWINRILTACQTHGIYILHLDRLESDLGALSDSWSLPNPSLPISSIFYNTKIQRKISIEMANEIVNEMVKKEKAIWEDPKTRRSCFILWRSLSDWSSVVYKTIEERGGVNGNIMTLYELCQSDAYSDAPWHGMDAALLVKVLQVLESNGRCRVFRNEDATSILEWGVKF